MEPTINLTQQIFFIYNISNTNIKHHLTYQYRMCIMKEKEYQTYPWWLTHQYYLKILPPIKKYLLPQLIVEGLQINCL